MRDTQGFGGFYQAMQYVGTPALWHALMAPFAKAGLPFITVRILHAGIAVGSVALLWHKSPFARWEKWLLAFGYFLAYEFSAIARSYALIVLLVFVALTLHEARLRRPLLYGAVLALLANSAVHGLLLAGILACAFVFEMWRSQALRRPVVLGVCVAAAGMLLAALQLLPASDIDPHLGEWHWAPSKVTKAVADAFVPIPSSFDLFWNSNVLYLLPPPVRWTVAGLLVSASAWVLRGRKSALALYLASAAALLALFAFKYFGGAHHSGLLFLGFLMGLWIARMKGTDAPTPAPRRRPWQRRLDRTTAWFVPAVLAFHVVGGACAIVLDTVKPFSEGPEAAAILERNGWLHDDTFIAVYTSPSGASIIGALDDPSVRFYYPQLERWGTYTSWSAQLRANKVLTLDDILERIDAAGAGASRVLLVVDQGPLNGTPQASARLQHVAATGHQVVGTWEEAYEFYWVLPAGGLLDKQ